jgi:ketosteroid isomerase-like protein
MNSIKILLIGILILNLYSSSALAISAQETIKAIQIDMWDAIEKGDIKRYASHIHPDYTAFNETATELLSGKDNELAAVKSWLSSASNITTQMHDEKVTIVGDIAWLTYLWSDSGMDNGKTFSSKGKSTRLYKKEKGRWLCIHSHFTLMPNSN